MGRRKKEKKVMVIGSMVVSVDADVDLGAGNNYETTDLDGKPFLPKIRNDVEYQVEEEIGKADDDTPILKTVTKKRAVGSCEQKTLFIWDMFEDTEGSALSSYINFWIMGLIVASAIVAIVETIPAIHKSQDKLWFFCETFFVANFTIEFVSRAITAPIKRDFWTTAMNWIDLIAIIPYYIDELPSRLGLASGGGPSFGFLRILRLSRAFRLIKLSKYSQGIRLVTNAMVNSVDALQLFALLLILVLVVFSSGIYYTERGEWTGDECDPNWIIQFGTGDCSLQHPGNCTCIQNRYYREDSLIGGTGKIEQYPSPFQSIPQSFWWCIVTLTTVGYGDMYPYSAMGKTVGVLCMLVGLIMLALPLSIIGTNFIEERNIMVEENKRRENEAERERLGADNDAEEEEAKFSMRKDLRELLAKADQLYESSDVIGSKLKRCAWLIKEMRSTVVKGQGNGSSDSFPHGAGNGRAPPSPQAGQPGQTSSAPQIGVGSSSGSEDISVEMAAVVPVYAVPVEAMEEMKELCIAILKRSIREMKIWDPMGDLPEMPAQILSLLEKEDGKGQQEEEHVEGPWPARCSEYEEISSRPPQSPTSPLLGAGVVASSAGNENSPRHKFL